LFFGESLKSFGCNAFVAESPRESIKRQGFLAENFSKTTVEDSPGPEHLPKARLSMLEALSVNCTVEVLTPNVGNTIADLSNDNGVTLYVL